MSVTAITTREAIDALEGRYEFREPDEVRAYLAQHSDLLGLLDEAAAKIPVFLPPDGRLVLEMVWDPEDEDEDDDGELFAMVPTRIGWQQDRPGYDRLLREWLVPAVRFAAGRFNVGIEDH